MGVYKIQIATWLCQELKLETLTFVRKQQAINALTKAFKQKNIKFTVKDNGNKTLFLNESSGELAAVVQG